MNILTDEEIFRCVPQEEDMMEFARTIEARRCLRYDGVDPVRFNEAMRHMDALI